MGKNSLPVAQYKLIADVVPDEPGIFAAYCLKKEKLLKTVKIISVLALFAAFIGFIVIYTVIRINEPAPDNNLSGIGAYILAKEKSDEDTGVMITVGIIFVLLVAAVLFLCGKVLVPKRSDRGYREFLKSRHNGHKP